MSRIIPPSRQRGVHSPTGRFAYMAETEVKEPVASQKPARAWSKRGTFARIMNIICANSRQQRQCCRKRLTHRVAIRIIARFPALVPRGSQGAILGGRRAATEQVSRAPVAQLDRVPGYELGGREFESLRARHFVHEGCFGTLFVSVDPVLAQAEYSAAATPPD